MSFSLWLGSPLPLFALQSSVSWALDGEARLYISEREQPEAVPFEILRAQGVGILEWTDGASLPAEAQHLAAVAAASRHGGLPILADAFRYACFARRSVDHLAWVDADSCCLPQGKGLRGLPDVFVASEPTRFAAPFRRLGLLDDTSFFAGSAKELPAWFRASQAPRLVTNSHLRLSDDLGRELLSRLLARRPAQITSDAGMTELRRLVVERSLWKIVLPSQAFNPVPSWRTDLFEEALSGRMQLNGARALHVFAAARRRLPPLDFSNVLAGNANVNLEEARGCSPKKF